MKYFFALILFIGLLIGCTNPVTTIVNPVATRIVMNSLWQVVPMATVNAVGRSLSRDATINLDANVAAYNAAHVDDQWFIVDGEIPGIDQAPACSIFIVDAITHVVMLDGGGNPFQHTNWPRAQLVSNYLGWLQDAQNAGGVLYIDVIPPAPDPPTAEQRYAKYSIYIINNVGAIKFERHCDTVDPGWYPDTPDQYFSAMSAWFQTIIQTDGNGAPDAPWTIISRLVYTAP